MQSNEIFITSLLAPFSLLSPLLITCKLTIKLEKTSEIKQAMVKFSKELEAQLIPEWKEAFMNYWQLKKQIKNINLARVHKQSQDVTNSNECGFSIFNPLRFLSKIFRRFHSSDEKTGKITQVRSKTMEDIEEEVYQTELAQLFSQDDEVRLFFKKLDEELNKVNQFYKSKEDEFLDREEVLSKQLQILQHLKHTLKQRRWKNSPTKPKIAMFSPSPASRDSSDYADTNGAYDETQSEISQTDDVIATLESNGVNFVNTETSVKKKGKPKMAIRIDIPATTPTRTISAVTSMLWKDLVDKSKKEGSGSDQFINKRKFKCAEKMIRGAFVDLYKGLTLLKTYSSLHMVAFKKILKKFDKVSCQHVSANYLKTVKRFHFINSDKVVRLMDEVESIFTKHFANNDRKKAMKFLRPHHQHNESHMITFFLGLFTGCFVSLVIIYAILAHLSGIFSPSRETSYLHAVYPVFSVFALLSLHMFMYGCNLYSWKRMRINYNFIFEFSPATTLDYRDAFLISTTFMTAVVAVMVIHLLLIAAGFSSTKVDFIPGFLLLIFIALLVCPFDILYRQTRYCFIRVIRNIVCSPFYKVLIVDFFMADQLTSQTTACYFFAGRFNTHPYETCKSGRLYLELRYVISFLPYYWRAMQCARRWFDECDSVHLANMGKYVSAMVAAGARLTYVRQPDSLWFAIVIVTSAVATVYQLYWDFVKDWGLLNPKSKNPWLRDDLILKKRSIYYMSIALNVILRVAWVESVMHSRIIGPVQPLLVEFFLASLEVIRRGHWNFYRLENEHLNNVGKFRAVRTVPLPFRESESDA